MSVFFSLPDTARVWILAAERTLDDGEQARLVEEVARFMDTWRSHGRPVQAQATFVENRFLLVGGYIEEGMNAGVSGCGIDAMLAAMDDSAERLGFAWLDGLQVFYRDASGAVRGLSRTAFRDEVRDGRVTADTRVFDTTIAELGLLRVFGLERRAGDAWHARVFRLQGAAAVA